MTILPANASLRVRLLRLLLLPLAIGLTIMGGLSYYGAYHETQEVYDAQLVHFARVLERLTWHEIEEGDASEKEIDADTGSSRDAYERHFAYRVQVNDRMILHSSNSHELGAITHKKGFFERYVGGRHWRFYVLRKGDITVEVAEEYEVRLDLVRHVLFGIFLPQLLLIPMIFVIIWLGVVRGIKPLLALSQLIRNRHAGSLEPLEVPVLLQEMVPVVDAINDLMRRMQEVLEKEKRFSSYAAHELRTPLAALKTQIQVALRSQSPAERDALFSESLQSLDRMIHLVEQLLSYVRVQRSETPFENVNLSALCSDLFALESRGMARHFTQHISPNLWVHGSAELLQALVRNLLSNAIKYTPEGGHVTLELAQEGDEIVLTLMDDGIGIDTAALPHVFDSFFRAASGFAEGSGLGLAIVKWAADVHRATIEISRGANDAGTCFTVRFAARKG